MAAVERGYVWNIAATSSVTVTTYFICRATSEYSGAFWHSKTVKKMYVNHTSHITQWLTMIEGAQSCTLH
jgi:hypothetical protein